MMLRPRASLVYRSKYEYLAIEARAGLQITPSALRVSVSHQKAGSETLLIAASSS
jgi:hypothetical protein